jgi:hypothetical protein
MDRVSTSSGQIALTRIPEEAEIRSILTEAVRGADGSDLLSTVFERFKAIGGLELDLPERDTPVRAADVS